MTAFYVTCLSGFLAAFLIGFTALLPWLLRRQARRLGRAPRLSLHYCIGYAIFMVVLVHMVVSMQAGMARGANLIGLDLATLAFLLIMIQVMLGMTLMGGGVRVRPLKTWHVMTMAGIVALAGVHVALNSMVLHSLLGG